MKFKFLIFIFPFYIFGDFSNNCSTIGCECYLETIYRSVDVNNYPLNYFNDDYNFNYEKECLQNKPIFIPIGGCCDCASYLKKSGVRFLSYPFDWMCIGYDSLLNIIDMDFKNFLNEEFLCGEKYYVKNLLYNIIFQHEFPVETIGKEKKLSSSWIKLLPEVKDKYKRRISRFYKALSSGRKVFFVRSLVFGQGEKISETQLSLLENFIIKFESLVNYKFPNLDFTLCIAIVANSVKSSYELVDNSYKNTRIFYLEWFDKPLDFMIKKLIV
jgi:hypothetical protein